MRHSVWRSKSTRQERPRPEAESDIAPEDERAAAVEYRGLIGDFVRAAREGDVDDESIAVALQVHRELLNARMLTENA